MSTARRHRRALLVVSRAEAWSLRQMAEGLAQGLEAIGIPAELHVIEQDGKGLRPFLERVRDLSDDGGFLIDVNAKMGLEETRGMARFSFITDHPYAHLERLLRLPPQARFGYVDRTHLPFLQAFGLAERAVFLPHGGPPPEANPLRFSERPAEALFVGRFHTSPRLDNLRDALAGTAPPVAEAILETAEAARAGTPLFEALCGALAGQDIQLQALGADGITTAIRAASHWAEAHARATLLNAVADLPVTVIGPVDDSVLDRPAGRMTFLGERPFDEVLDRMRQTRLLLNSVPVFPEGAHERIWYGMAAGCAVATDPSRFLAADFTDGDSILFWPMETEEVTATVTEALADPERLQAIAERARRIYAERHTWTERARRIDSALHP